MGRQIGNITSPVPALGGGSSCASPRRTRNPMKKRRVHKKSRLGCEECKRRHIKCDEKRPVCANCNVSQRQCSFQVTGRRINGSSTPSQPPEPSALPLPASVLTREAQPTLSAPSEPINMLHAELLIHYSFTVSVPDFDPDLDRAATKLVLRNALTYPWLMHEILAISALHLAVRPGQSPEATAIYLEHASSLQTQALNLFNAEALSLNEDNCSAVLIFSSILGRHLLADTLVILSESADLSTFISRYVDYVQIHQGLRAITRESKDFLNRSAAWSLMVSAGFMRPMEKRSSRLASLRSWVESSSAEGDECLDGESVEACLEAIDTLQVGLDDALDPDAPPFRRSQIALIWAVLYPPSFLALISRHCPQALVILAHYAVLLHHARHIWQIKQAGANLLRLVADFLGPSYGERLAWPLAAIQEESPGFVTYGVI